MLARRRKSRQAAAPRSAMVLDIGCGMRPARDATHGIDMLTPDKVHCPTPDFAYIRHDLLDIPWFRCKEPFDKVYASHILEHFEWEDAVRIVREVNRILRLNGIFEVRVPNLAKVAQFIADGGQPEQSTWMPLGENSPVGWLFGRLGPSERRSGLAWNKHRWAYTRETLTRLVTAEGFVLKGYHTDAKHWEVHASYRKDGIM